MELWKKINGFENYSISSEGRIRNDKRNSLKSQRVNSNGYSITSIYNEGEASTFRVHRLVAEAFIDNPYNKPEINHLDGNKLNNNVDNLEWCTKSENMIHAYDTGLESHHATYGMLGKSNPNAGRKGTPIRIVETGEEFDSIKSCAEAINGTQRGICDALHGWTKSHRGYRFELI